MAYYSGQESSIPIRHLRTDCDLGAAFRFVQRETVTDRHLDLSVFAIWGTRVTFGLFRRETKKPVRSLLLSWTAVRHGYCDGAFCRHGGSPTG